MFALLFGYLLALVFLVLSIVFYFKSSKSNKDDAIARSTETITLNTEIKVLKEQLTLSENKFNSLIEEKDQFKSFNDSLNAEIISYKNKITLLEDELKSTNEDKRIIVEENSDLQNKLQSLQEQFDNNTEVEHLNHNLDVTQKHLDEALIELNTLNQSFKNVQSAFDESKSINIKLQDEISSLRANNEHLNSGNSLLVSQNAEFISIKHSLEKQIEELLSNTSVEINTVDEVKLPSRILLVDDSIVIRTKLGNFLKDNGFEITLAKDGEDAIGILNGDNKFNLIVTDLEMPNMNGYELISAVKKLAGCENIPFLAITGHDEITISIDGNENLYGISKKPWNDAVLLRKIKDISK